VSLRLRHDLRDTYAHPVITRVPRLLRQARDDPVQMTDFIPRPHQQAILNYRSGKMGISAVPGAGKTHTLSALAAQIIASGRLDPEQEVLVVTLVNAAVDNFSRRIGEFVRESGLIPHLGYRVRTLHGLAHDIVREKPAAVGLEERFQIIDEREAAYIRREAARAWLHAHPYDFDDYLADDMDDGKRDWVRREKLPQLLDDIALAFIRSAKDRRLTPDALHRDLDAVPAPLPLAAMGCEIYLTYQRALIYRGAVDFDDLIRLALDLLENDEDYLERLRYRWPVVLEDEAQDSSKLQEEILRQLSGGGNWVRVGDPNQAIYETFTTASPKYLINFIREEADPDLPNELPVSGRSQPRIIALANRLIDWTRAEHPEPEARDALNPPHIQPAPVDDPQPNPPDNVEGLRLVGRKYSAEGEVEAVVKSLEKWLPAHPESTVAVLVPTNAHGTRLIEALEKRRLEYVEYLESTSSTRATAGRLGDVITYLADPQSALKLARAYLSWRDADNAEDESTRTLFDAAAKSLRKCAQVETFSAPTSERDYLAGLADEDSSVLDELERFRALLGRWGNAISLPIDQMILTLAGDLFARPNDLALAHKLALVLRQVGDGHADWRLPELSNELNVIARNERRFLGFSEDDSGFDPQRHKGKVVVTTMHKAKGLEWDRVYLMAVNNYDFPSNQPNDVYRGESFFVRGRLNLVTETLAQLDAAQSKDAYSWYEEGRATLQARLDYIRERVRLLYVGVTRAKRELIVTWNSGRTGSQTQALPFAALQGWWEEVLRRKN
jgi:DNA helicase-2/ATP-dependent DNA helicase PcrA